MSEGQAQPVPVQEAAPSPPVAKAAETGGPTASVDTGKSTVENILKAPDAQETPQTETTTLSDGSDLNALAEGLNSGSVDPDAELQKLAGGETTFGQAPTENVGGLPTEPTDVDAKQAELDARNAKTTVDLQDLASKGNEEAIQQLKNLGIEPQLNPLSQPEAATGTTLPPIENSQQAGQSEAPTTAAEAVTPSVQPEVPGEKPPLAEETGESVVAAAEQITKEAAENQTATTPPEGQTQQQPEAATPVQSPEAPATEPTVENQPVVPETGTETPSAPEQVKTPEQEAQELKVARDKLVAKFAREYPNMDLTSEAAQAYLDMASESKENMDAVNGMHEQFLGAEAQKTAEKMGIDTKEFAKGSVNGIIENIEQQLDALKKALAEGDQSKGEEVKKKNWLLRLLKGFGKFLAEAAMDIAVGVTQGVNEAGKKLAKAN